MLRGGLEVPEFDIKGETVLQPLYGLKDKLKCLDKTW